MEWIGLYFQIKTILGIVWISIVLITFVTFCIFKIISKYIK